METGSSPPVDSVELLVVDGSESHPNISALLSPLPSELSISPTASSNDGIQPPRSSEPESESTAAETPENQTTAIQPVYSNRETEGGVAAQYDKYVQVVSNSGYTSLNVVREFMDSIPDSEEHSTCKDCLACQEFTPYLLLLSGDKVEEETLPRFDDHNSGLSSSRATKLMDTIKARCTNPEVPDQQLVLLVEDLKPSGLKVKPILPPAKNTLRDITRWCSELSSITSNLLRFRSSAAILELTLELSQDIWISAKSSPAVYREWPCWTTFRGIFLKGQERTCFS